MINGVFFPNSQFADRSFLPKFRTRVIFTVISCLENIAAVFHSSLSENP